MRNDGKDAIFLGAGASAPDRAPTDLLNAYLNPRRGLELNNDRRKRIQTLLDTLFPGCSTEGSVYPQFEELLGIIELAILRKETFTDYGSVSFSDRLERSLYEAREDLILSIAELLAESLRRNNGDRTKYDKLVHTLGTDIDSDSVLFLTTNYDILLDNALGRFFGERNIPNYGMEHFVEWTNGNSERTRLDHDDYHVKPTHLLKLHGSLNWRYCPRCLSISVTPYRKSGSVSAYGPNPCLECRQHMLPMIIPPNYLKDINNTHLLQIWNRAEQELKQVNRIIFCGYSLPPADLQVKYLLKRAQVNRMNTDSNIEIIVMNKSEDETVEEWEQNNSKTRNQYERFFGRPNVRYLPYGLESLIENGLSLLDE